MKRIIVCVKPVPDPQHWHKVSMDPVTMTLKREGIPNILNPLDKHALEAALCIREMKGGEVVLMSMAPPFAESTLKEGLAMGADRAFLLSDKMFAGSDTLATSRVLAAGCRWIGEFDMVMLGNFSIDGSTAQVCSQLAEFLDLPNIMHVVGLELQNHGKMIVTQKIEQGYVKLEATSPLVLSVRKELNKPRYITFTGIIEAESKEIKVLTNQDLNIDPGLIGLEGSPTKMAGLEVRKFERKKERLEGSIDEIVQQLADKIYQCNIS
ncbi:MAG: electron transfer flavoprotein subunit beta/FixA family protein [Desulfobacterales bacterium]